MKIELTMPVINYLVAVVCIILFKCAIFVVAQHMFAIGMNRSILKLGLPGDHILKTRPDIKTPNALGEGNGEEVSPPQSTRGMGEL